MQDAAALMGVEVHEMMDDLHGILPSYPEHDLFQKAVHFSVYERGRKWLFEGEDRTRFFLWQTSPFYDREFFSRCMSVPDDFKVDYRFYSRVLKALSPALTRIPDAHLGIAPGDVRYRFKRALVRHYLSLPASLRELLRRAVKGRRIPDASAVQDKHDFVCRISDENHCPILDRERLKVWGADDTRVRRANVMTLTLLQKAYHDRGLL